MENEEGKEEGEGEGKFNQQIEQMKTNNCSNSKFQIEMQVQASKKLTEQYSVGANITVKKGTYELETSVKQQIEENKDIEVNAVINSEKQNEYKAILTEKDNLIGDWQVEKIETYSSNKQYVEIQTSVFNQDGQLDQNSTQFEVAIQPKINITQNTSLNARIGLNQDSQLNYGVALCHAIKDNQFMVGLNANSYDIFGQASWQHQTSHGFPITTSVGYSQAHGPQISLGCSIL